MSQFVVANVRATSLGDALRWVLISRGRNVSMIDDAIFQAQRLQSSCERSLGTRDRLVDKARRAAASRTA